MFRCGSTCGFRSYSLGQLRERMFTDRQLLTSQELSLLNLILLRVAPQDSVESLTLEPIAQ